MSLQVLPGRTGTKGAPLDGGVPCGWRWLPWASSCRTAPAAPMTATRQPCGPSTRQRGTLDQPEKGGQTQQQP